MKNKENIMNLISPRNQFRRHIFFYLIANTGLWLLFLLTQNGHHFYDGINTVYIWPMLTTLIWGAGIVYHWTKVNNLSAVLSKKTPLGK